jgi:hypothetical protein
MQRFRLKWINGFGSGKTCKSECLRKDTHKEDREHFMFPVFDSFMWIYFSSCPVILLTVISFPFPPVPRGQ